MITQKSHLGWSIAECTEMHRKQVTKVRGSGTLGICKSRHPDKDSQWDIRLKSETEDSSFGSFSFQGHVHFLIFIHYQKKITSIGGWSACHHHSPLPTHKWRTAWFAYLYGGCLLLETRYLSVWISLSSPVAMVTDMVVLFEPIQPPIQTSLPPLHKPFPWVWLYGFCISVGVCVSAR